MNNFDENEKISLIVIYVKQAKRDGVTGRRMCFNFKKN